MSRVLPVLLVPGLLLPGLAVAQSDSVFVDIGPCMAMEEDAQRYACYDLLEEQIRASRARDVNLPVVSLPRSPRQDTPAEPAQAPEPEPAAAGRQDDDVAVADFGREEAVRDQARETTARVLDNADGGQELVDTIAALEERVPGQWQVTLTSGQVWTQVNSKRYRLREGMEVRIYPSPFGGSFRLAATNRNGFIQVRRVQ